MPETSVTSVDLINHAIDNNPTKMGDVFNSLVMQKVADAVATRKQELAQSMFDSAEEDDSVESDEEDQQDAEGDEVADEDNEQQDDENEDDHDEDTQTDA